MGKAKTTTEYKPQTNREKKIGVKGLNVRTKGIFYPREKINASQIVKAHNNKILQYLRSSP